MTSDSISHLQTRIEELTTLNRLLNEKIEQLHTEIRALTDARRAAEQEKLAKLAMFVAVGHDLRQPLHAIALVQGGLAASGQDENARRAAARLKRAVSSMSRILDKLDNIGRANEPGATEAPEDRSSPKADPEAGHCGGRRDQGTGSRRSSPTLYVVDDDHQILDAAQALLHEAGYAVEPFASGSAFFESFRPDGKGCILVDALMPDMDGFEVIERLKAAGCELPAIMITGNGDLRMAVRAMRAGAADFIEKPLNANELLSAIGRALDQTSSAASRETAVGRLATLSERERQIFALVIEGHPSKSIAARLGVSRRTVENHRAAIMRKTGARSVAQLVRLALAAE